MVYTIKTLKSSLRNNILITFFLIIALGGIIANFIFNNQFEAIIIKAAIDKDVINELGRHFTIVTTGLTISGIVIALFVSMLLSNTITRPIKQLTRGMVKIAEGKFHTRIDIESHDEIGQLASGFNLMAEQVELALGKVKAAKEYTDNIVITVPSILIVLDQNLVVLSTNMAYEKLHGQYPTLQLKDFIRPLEYNIRHNIETGETLYEEIIFSPEGSQKSLIFFSIISQIGEKGEVGNEKSARVLLTITDITERKQAEEKIQLQLSRLNAIHSIERTVSSSLNLSVILEIMLNQITSQLGIDAAGILLLNENSLLLEHAASIGFRSNALKHTKLKLGESNAGRAATERSIITIPDLKKEPGDFMRSTLLPNEDFQSYVAVPLIAKGIVKGVLELFHRSQLNTDADWLEFIETIADQAAIAIDNSSLFEGLQRSNVELKLAYDTTLEGWSRAMDMRDKETEGHTQRVTEMTLNIAREFNIKEEEIVHIRRGALLHDIGKIGIPDDILLKPGPLTNDEWVKMRRHPVYARNMLYPIKYLRPAIEIPYCHHEKWDSTGYPRGMKGEDIPISARIFAVVDVWDALRSERPYRPAWPKGKVIEHIRSLSGTHFDSKTVEIFLKMNT
ncbi:MAG: HD domain-containing phosphohydrolase [Thermodesulfovibrionia bacterium]